MTPPRRADAPSHSQDSEDLEALQRLLDSVPAPCEPLDLSALDGFLCGVLLQPHEVPSRMWLARVTDLDGRPLPAGFDASLLHSRVMARYAKLEQAISRRDWFDPWVFELEGPASHAQSVLPWAAGFAAAMDLFPALMGCDDAALLEPLALVYLHFDADDLDAGDTLRQVIDTLEPPADLAEAVQDLVRSVMLMADVTRPRAAARGSSARQRASSGKRPRR